MSNLIINFELIYKRKDEEMRKKKKSERCVEEN